MIKIRNIIKSIIANNIKIKINRNNKSKQYIMVIATASRNVFFMCKNLQVIYRANSILQLTRFIYLKQY